MITIHKFPLEVMDEQRVRLPIDSEILCVQTQGKGFQERPCLWVQLDTDNQENQEDRTIAMRGTGHDLKEAAEAEYVGTFQLSNGELVFHVFDRGIVENGATA